MITLICKHCGKEYKADRDTRVYCSNACYHLSCFVDKVEKVCGNCNNTFLVLPHDFNKRIFCSIKCKHQAEQKTKKIICETCGKIFEINWQGSLRKYCSFECNYKSKDTRVSASCAVCGKSYLARPHDLENGLDKYCSNECRYRGVQTGSGRSWKAGKRSDLGNIHFRSSWEANYARLLNYYRDRFIIKSWEFEPDVLDLDGITYIPDFKVTNINGEESYHEVKGWMDNDSKKKIEAMKSINPSLLVIDSEKYNIIEKTYSGVIPNWERA